MQFKLAILTVLAARADGRATLDELNSEIEALTDGADRDTSSVLDDVDLFQSGLVIPDGGSLEITQAGRLALNAIETSAELPPASISLASAGAPALLMRNGSHSGARLPGGETAWRTRLTRLLSTRLQRTIATWRRHLKQDTTNVKAGLRQTGNVSGAAIALLSLLVILICAGTVIALTEIRSLKLEVAAVQREFLLIKEREARIADEKAKQDADQQREATNRSGLEKGKVEPDRRTDQATLNLTQEEIGLIRNFIKPAPVSGTPAPAINIGDAVVIATIPLPSQLIERIPRLLGARFTTHNGSIIILKRGSRQADAVLLPN